MQIVLLLRYHKGELQNSVLPLGEGKANKKVTLAWLTQKSCYPLCCIFVSFPQMETLVQPMEFLSLPLAYQVGCLRWYSTGSSYVIPPNGGIQRWYATTESSLQEWHSEAIEVLCLSTLPCCKWFPPEPFHLEQKSDWRQMDCWFTW